MGAEQSQMEDVKLADFRQDFITFFINGKEHIVKTNGCDPDIGPQYLLIDYLRDKIGLTATKYMCREGGCGACIVSVKSTNAATGESEIRSANSCLLPVFACDGFEITTVEALGNARAGYNPIQERLVEYYGTQCGFCSPGFVMSMHSIAQSNPRFTPGDVEYSFDGNICRCTGYRPIIDAFKSLSTNPSEKINFKCTDIEDTYKCPLRDRKRSNDETEKMELIQIPRNLYLRSTSNSTSANDDDDSPAEQWVKVTTLKTLYEVIRTFSMGRIPYRLVAGYTGSGVYKYDGPYQGFVDINDVPELQYREVGPNGIILGGAVTLTTAIALFAQAMQFDSLVYARDFNRHFRRIAALSIRNQGTVAGNLMLKHSHREFPSDVFTLLETIGASLTIGSSLKLTEHVSLLEFLKMDMNGKIILSIHLPAFTKYYVFRSYKLGKRYQNAASYLNAGFLFQLDPNTLKIVDRPRICYGGIAANFIHANSTEIYLKGQPLTTQSLGNALKILQNEAIPDPMPELGSRKYRLGLAQSYLYRFFLSVNNRFVSPELKSGGADIQRELNTGRQVYDTNKKIWPLNQPIPKIESFPQVSGEAQFINDMPPQHGELFGVFVVSTVANARLASVDASKALGMPGVVAFITSANIPGANNYAPFSVEREEIFVERDIQYAGQSIGLLVAETKQAAFQARPLVEVRYENIRKPKLIINGDTPPHQAGINMEQQSRRMALPCRGIDKKASKQILEELQQKRNEFEEKEEIFEEGLGDKVYVVKGEFRTPNQYHFHLETQISICVPIENGMNVYTATQHMDVVQVAIAACLKVPLNTVNIFVRRLGGAFGAKVSKAAQIACAAAVASYNLHRPVRVALDLETNMHMIGKKLPYLVKYNAKVNKEGKILKMDCELWCDTGYVGNEPSTLYGMMTMQSCYRANDWNMKPLWELTNTAPNTFCRSPGSAQGIAAIEHIMEHVAYTVQKDPLEVRMLNFIHKGDPLIGVPGAKQRADNMLPGMLDELRSTGEYESRKQAIIAFNQNNRWKKRGISVVTQRFLNHYLELRFPTFISVYAADGTVNVSHGGIEMGQGINSKVAQVVAFTLGIPLDSVKVQPTNTIISPNTSISAASTTSESVCSSAREACKILLQKLAPVRERLGGNPTWLELVTAANAEEILLTAQFQHQTGQLTSYDIWGAAMTEVEVDAMTGDSKIIRLDIIEDVGQSLSPLIDIGQIEGALVQGLGWWVTEELVYDKTTGQLLTDNTWSYKPMLPADIPEDFRVTLLRNAPNPFGVLSSKAVAEPPLNLAVGVIFAIRQAINSARADVGNYDWYPMDGPVTKEVIRKLCLTSPEQFVL